MKPVIIILLALIIVSTTNNIYSEITLPEDIKTISINLKQYIDLADLEYDDLPYPGRTDIGHIFIPSLIIKTTYMDLIAGGWYQHVYIQYDEDRSPERLYPYMSAIFHPWKGSEICIGNYENLFPFPNTIYNEFLFFEERPVSAGLKFTLKRDSFNLTCYLDWLELDIEEHPEEFINGILFTHNLNQNFYYKLYNHYHHRGGQLNKDTHPVRIEQDIVTSPLIGIKYKGLFTEIEYYLSTFSQNFKPSTYGNAASILLGYTPADKLTLSYLCWYNDDYYHKDAHIFYLKKRNVLHRIRADYNIFTYKKIIDLFFTVNLYGIDPPGIDLRLFGKIDINIFDVDNKDDNREVNKSRIKESRFL